jgi:hypothetical protein
MKLFEQFRGRTRGAAAPDPGSPHLFRSMNDPGIGAAVSGVGASGGEGGQALGLNAMITGNFVREQRCGVPGCGRNRDDAIHFPEG